MIWHSGSPMFNFITIFQLHSPPPINKAVLEPRVLPAFAITYFCNHCNIRSENTSKYVDTLTLFSNNLNQRSLTPRWPLTPCLLRSLVWLYPRIIVSKSHDNTSMYVDTVINFANYHIHTHTTTYIHILGTTYILRTEWVITQSLTELSSGETKRVYRKEKTLRQTLKRQVDVLPAEIQNLDWLKNVRQNITRYISNLLNCIKDAWWY